MEISRKDFESPHNVGILDLNGPGAFAHYGLEPRDYPGLIPSVDTALAIAGEKPLVLWPWQRELHLHAELVAVTERDAPRAEGDRVEGSLLGYCLGLGIWDNAMVADLKRDVPRDITLNQHYAYLIDGCRQTGEMILTSGDLPPINKITLTLHIPGRAPASFHQGALLFDGSRLLRECNKLMAFDRGDVFCLGPSDAPVVIAPEERFPEGSVIRVEGPPFPALYIPVDDRRDLDFTESWPGCEVDFVSRYPYLRTK